MEQLENNSNKENKRSFVISSRMLTIVTLVTIILVICSVWLIGLKDNHTKLHNAVISITILSIMLFIFLTIGFYKTIQIKNTIEKVTDLFKLKGPGFLKFKTIEYFIPAYGGIEGIIAGILLWVFIAIICAFIFWLLGVAFLLILAGTGGFLYLIFIKNLKYIFKINSNCRHNYIKSIANGFLYTILYFGWAYAIVFGIVYLKK